MTTPTVRSFHARRGRLSPSLLAALDALWPQYGVDVPRDSPATALDLAALGCGDLPWVLEIGSGMGETTAMMAAAEPGTAILAVDVHTRGIARLLQLVDEGGLANVRVAHGDAVVLLRDMLPPGSLAGIRVYFPDPWPKARHHKRRLLQPAFAALAASRLRPGGSFHAATDWVDYAEQMRAVLDAEPLLENRHDGAAPRPGWRPLTRYEQAGLTQGHVVTDLVYERVPGPPP